MAARRQGAGGRQARPRPAPTTAIGRLAERFDGTWFMRPPRGQARSRARPSSSPPCQCAEIPRSSTRSRDVIRADSKITGRPLPGWVPPPTRYTPSRSSKRLRGRLCSIWPRLWARLKVAPRWMPCSSFPVASACGRSRCECAASTSRRPRRAAGARWQVGDSAVCSTDQSRPWWRPCPADGCRRGPACRASSSREVRGCAVAHRGVLHVERRVGRSLAGLDLRRCSDGSPRQR